MVGPLENCKHRDHLAFDNFTYLEIGLRSVSLVFTSVFCFRLTIDKHCTVLQPPITSSPGALFGQGQGVLVLSVMPALWSHWTSAHLSGNTGLGHMCFIVSVDVEVASPTLSVGCGIAGLPGLQDMWVRLC